MNFLVEELKQSKKFKELLSKLKNLQSPVAISGLVDVQKSIYINGILENNKKPACIVSYNELQAKKYIKI